MVSSIENKDFPGLYQSADATSLIMQKRYFGSMLWYILTLFAAAFFAFFNNEPEPSLKIISAILFLISLSLMVWQKVTKPEDLWYNGRAVAESVKTRTWRFIMKATPYEAGDESATQRFIADLKEILKENENLISKLGSKTAVKEPISQPMKDIRLLNLEERLNFYKQHRIEDQQIWYTKKAIYNKNCGDRLFWVIVVLHAIAIFFLLINIKEPSVRFPISVIGVAASSALTWFQAKKYSELFSSYTLTAHEISIIKSEGNVIANEQQLSEYIINCETAFSREHTQWVARKRR